MALKFHPEQGTILICDFKGFVVPEMVKRRPVVVVSPRFKTRDRLCTVVPLSTTQPHPKCGYHLEITLEEPLPDPYGEPTMWAKADMLCAVSHDRLQLPFAGKDEQGKRIYHQRRLPDAVLHDLLGCILTGMGLHRLTSHL